MLTAQSLPDGTVARWERERKLGHGGFDLEQDIGTDPALLFWFERPPPPTPEDGVSCSTWSLSLLAPK